MNTPILWNKYWVSPNCLKCDEIQSVEYTLMLGITLCSIRVINKHISEVYLFDRTSENKILAVEPSKSNVYKQIDGVIYRDDGARYEYTQNGLIRVNDKRLYYSAVCDQNHLEDIVYSMYRLLYESPALAGYRTQYLYDITKIDIPKIRELINYANHLSDTKLNANAQYVKKKLYQTDFLKEDSNDN